VRWPHILWKKTKKSTTQVKEKRSMTAKVKGKKTKAKAKKKVLQEAMGRRPRETTAGGDGGGGGGGCGVGPALCTTEVVPGGFTKGVVRFVLFFVLFLLGLDTGVCSGSDHISEARELSCCILRVHCLFWKHSQKLISASQICLSERRLGSDGNNSRECCTTTNSPKHTVPKQASTYTPFKLSQAKHDITT
jgi:hypothetical protein